MRPCLSICLNMLTVLPRVEQLRVRGHSGHEGSHLRVRVRVRVRVVRVRVVRVVRVRVDRNPTC